MTVEMKYTYSKSKNTIKLVGKELTLLDRFVLDFISHVNIKYVIVSGYVAILFGRSRSTEDIDMFITDEGIDAFRKFYEEIVNGGKYYAINAKDADDAYELMTVDKSSLRFAERDTFDPNFEVKFAMKETDFYSMENPWIVDFGAGARVRISPMELEIVYKLYLGSEKDFDDAAHLYTVFKEILDLEKLRSFIRELNIKTSIVRRVLDGDI